MDVHSQPEPKGNLGEISTEWELVHDSGQFVRRYTLAIERYLNALIKNRHDAEDVLHDFLLRVLKHGFVRVRREGGRFRDYLKTAVRNAALNHLQRKVMPKQGAVKPLLVPAADLSQLAADQQWVVHWRKALLDRVWKALQRHESRASGNLAYTVLRLLADHPEDDSEGLAARVSESVGYPLRTDTFRKQLSRARRLFAQFLVIEVAQTLDHPTPEQVEEELSELGFMRYVRRFLAPDWPMRGWPGKNR
jgi:DNA-directed RNA polymerase specialized sigma24 family protein